MRIRSKTVLLLVVLPSCSPLALYTGSVSVEGVDAPEPLKLHWDTEDMQERAAEVGRVVAPRIRGKTVAVEGRLHYEFAADPGPIDVAFWYDSNGNEVLDAGDKMGRVSKRVEGADVGLGCVPDKAIIPHIHLGETLGVAAHFGSGASPPGRLRPCAIDLHITGQLEPQNPTVVDRSLPITIMSAEYVKSPETQAPLPLRRDTVLELDHETTVLRDGSIRYEGEDWSGRASFASDGRPTTVVVEQAADARVFTYTYRWTCADEPPYKPPAYLDELTAAPP